MEVQVVLALVGAGRMGRVHGRALASLEGVRVAWVVDSASEAAKSLAESLGARSTAVLADALGDTTVDGVVITTPSPTHAELTIAVAEAGKAIFVEKPIATDIASGLRAVNAVERAGVPAQVGFQRRYDPAYLEARLAIAEGRLGRPWVFRGVGRDPGPLPLDYLLTCGGVFLDMGSHDLDTARWWLGEVDEVYATGGALAYPALAERGLADTAVAVLRFRSGAVGTVEISWRNPYGYEVRAEMVGELGRVVAEQDRYPELNLYDNKGGHFSRPQDFETRFRQSYVAEVEAFAEGLRKGVTLEPSPRDALESLRLVLAAQRSLEEGRPVRVEEVQ